MADWDKVTYVAHMIKYMYLDKRLNLEAVQTGHAAPLPPKNKKPTVNQKQAMAGYRGHISGAIVFFIVYMIGLIFLLTSGGAEGEFVLSNNVYTVLALFAICVMFGLWPDVDTNSKGQDIFYSLFFVMDVALIYYGRFHEAAYLGLFCILPILGKHRGWTHTYWAMIVIPSPILILPYVYSTGNPWAGLPFYGAAVVGYFSHLFMDGLVADIQPGRKRKLKRR